MLKRTLKRIILICILLTLTIPVVTSPVLATSLSLYAYPTSAKAPAIATWETSPMTVYYSWYGVYRKLGQGLRYGVSTDINASITIQALPSSSFTLGYEPMPLQYLQFDENSWQAAPNTVHYDWLRLNLPDEPQYHNKNYQFAVLASSHPPKVDGRISGGVGVKLNVFVHTN